MTYFAYFDLALVFLVYVVRKSTLPYRFLKSQWALYSKIHRETRADSGNCKLFMDMKSISNTHPKYSLDYVKHTEPESTSE